MKMTVATVMTVTKDGTPVEYKLPVIDANEQHALQYVLRSNHKFTYVIEEWEAPHPVYSMSFSEEFNRHTVAGLNYDTALWLMNELADVHANPHMIKTEW